MGSEITSNKLSAKDMDAEVELARQDHLDAQNSAINAVEKAISCGARLVKIKQSCAHGEFMPKIEAAGMGQRTANRYMQAYRNKETLLENGHSDQFEGSIRALLSLPAGPEDVNRREVSEKQYTAEDWAIHITSALDHIFDDNLLGRMEDGDLAMEIVKNLEKRSAVSANKAAWFRGRLNALKTASVRLIDVLDHISERPNVEVV